MEVSGSSWGMACNTIHFIDLFSYLINDANFIVTKKNFSNNIYQSKRGKNFYEINGLMKGINGKHSLSISCDESKKSSLYIKINGNIENIVDENHKIWTKNINGLIKSYKINLPFQSDLTGKLIDDLIHKRCRLTTYANSTKNHIPLLKTIKSHLSKILKEN